MTNTFRRLSSFRPRRAQGTEPPNAVLDQIDINRRARGWAPLDRSLPFRQAVLDTTPLPVTTENLMETTVAAIRQMQEAMGLPELPDFDTALRRERERLREGAKTWRTRGSVKDLQAKAKKAKAEQIIDPMDPRLATFWLLAERAANDLDFCHYYDLFVDRIGGPNREKRK